MYAKQCQWFYNEIAVTMVPSATLSGTSLALLALSKQLLSGPCGVIIL